VIRAIRQWKADVVLSPRPNDYHPDHRYTGTLVQDAAYMVVVPNVTPEVPALRKNPIFLYFEDGFQKPYPFRPDVVVAIDDVWDTKIAALDAHTSQVYEWLPWVDGRLAEVPADSAARKAWLARSRSSRISDAVAAALAKRYGAQAVQHAEAFELCEYGRRPPVAELQEMFPK
jgi:LmbE family N-acetylglucosaminyl deacetylase